MYNQNQTIFSTTFTPINLCCCLIYISFLRLLQTLRIFTMNSFFLFFFLHAKNNGFTKTRISAKCFRWSMQATLNLIKVLKLFSILASRMNFVKILCTDKLDMNISSIINKYLHRAIETSVFQLTTT